MKKIVFLDIDGVLNSYRSVIAYGVYPIDNTSSENFDMVAVGLIREACKKCHAQIVLSSTWRLYRGWENLKTVLDLPIIDKTPKKLSSIRGEEIWLWLDENKVDKYVIVDDSTDILKCQQSYYVQVDPYEGLAWKDYAKILKILGIEEEE